MAGATRGRWDLSRPEDIPIPPNDVDDGDPRQSQRVARLHTDGDDYCLRIALVEVLLWMLSVLILAFRYAHRPLALLLAIYIAFYAAMLTKNMMAQSIHVTLSPLCRLPGATLLNLPFCGAAPPALTLDKSSHPVVFDFDNLMTLQGKLEQVLEHSANRISLPNEMKRSETTIRDLRALVRSSDLPLRWELVREFDGYIKTARRSTTGLQQFITHCSSTINSIISINQWTPGYVDSLAHWFFTPDRYFTKPILDKYIKHTALVSDYIGSLILEAQTLLELLNKAENHLSVIYELSSHDSNYMTSHRSKVLWTVWTVVGANLALLRNLSRQLALLHDVDTQRIVAMRRVSTLVQELEAIQLGLRDLRHRIATQELQTEAEHARNPLKMHIETINRGLERLEEARRRISVADGSRVGEALNKAQL